MRALAKSLLTAVGIRPNELFERVATASLEAALSGQKLGALAARLREAVPDISDQYTRSFGADGISRYREAKARGMHAFQVQCALDALDRMGGGRQGGGRYR